MSRLAVKPVDRAPNCNLKWLIIPGIKGLKTIFKGIELKWQNTALNGVRWYGMVWYEVEKRGIGR